MTAPFSWRLPYAWPRKPLLARNVVATSQPLAAQAGLQMIAAGGNAVDAIVATAITLTLVEPVSNGIGSDAFAIVWDGKQLHGLNASGRSPAAWTPEYFDGGAVPAMGWNSVTVPGAVSAWVALHANHARELTDKARAACAGMIDAGIPMVSQSVLLRGVNDDAATLEALMRAFVECRVKPYYLHHGDLAPGTGHLRTSLEHGQELMRQLRGRVSGLCQPEYVLDIPGGHGKVPVGPNYLSSANPSATADSFAERGEPGPESRYRIVDYCGDVHLYPPES